MKFHSFYTQLTVFLLILLCFIIPPLIVPLLVSDNAVFVTTFIEWNFPLHQLINFTVFITLFLICSDLKIPSQLTGKNRIIIEILAAFIVSFGLLFFFEFLFNGISLLIKSPEAEATITKPDSFLSWIFCILTFGFGAFNEEFLYRFYFIDSLKLLLKNKLNEKVLFILCELLGCVVFAFAHLYLGWFSVINAACAHVVLRLCYKKSHTIWTGVSVHFLYNIISLLLIA